MLHFTRCYFNDIRKFLSVYYFLLFMTKFWLLYYKSKYAFGKYGKFGNNRVIVRKEN